MKEIDGRSFGFFRPPTFHHVAALTAAQSRDPLQPLGEARRHGAGSRFRRVGRERTEPCVERVCAEQEVGDTFVQFEIARQQHRAPGAGVVVQRDQVPAQQRRAGIEGLARRQAIF